MTAVLLVFGCVLLVNGLVHGDYAADHRIAPPVGTSRVPESILNGGPIIDTAQHPYQVPAKTVILSFDDGPSQEWTPRILKVLRKYHVPATFFVIGDEVAREPGLVHEMRASGAELGVHTFTHPDLAYMPNWRRQLELSETQLAIASAAGVTTSLVRPPYSSTNSAVDNNSWPVMTDLGRRGYTTVLTSFDTEDWRRPGVDRIVRNGTPTGGQGGIILMHDAGGNRAQTVVALDRLIPKLQRMGYRFGTVAQAIHQRTANPVASVSERRRGAALLAVVHVADTVTSALAVMLLVVGALVLLRLALMFVFARRHARGRRNWSWGEPVTEPVSIVVPAYNERKTIADTVRSLMASDHPVEVIVVDDGSTDGTTDVVRGLDLPDVRVIRKRNGGKASALNAGITAARHELIVMMDADTIFAPDTVRRLIQPFADSGIGAVAGNAKVAGRGKMVVRWQHIEYVIGFNIDRRVYDLLHCMPTVPGAVGAFRRRALQHIRRVSSATLAEDTDLTMSVIRAGWHVVYEPAAVAWTEAPATLGQLWRQRYRWSYGTMQSMWKHRRAVFERGPSGRFGRIGLANLALFQVVLPLLAPLVDVFLLYGLLFLDPLTTVLVWFGALGAQLVGAIYAFRLDGEPLRQLWALPLQQFVYRQLMYAVLIQSIVTALGGVRLRWHKLSRIGGLDVVARQP